MVKFRFSKRNSPFTYRQKITFEDYYNKPQEISIGEYFSLFGVLTSLRESGELEFSLPELEVSSSLPDSPYSSELSIRLKNGKYYLDLVVQPSLFEEIWKVIVIREREITHLFVIKLLHLTRRLRWGRVDVEEKEVSSEVVSV